MILSLIFSFSFSCTVVLLVLSFLDSPQPTISFKLPVQRSLVSCTPRHSLHQPPATRTIPRVRHLETGGSEVACFAYPRQGVLQLQPRLQGQLQAQLQRRPPSQSLLRLDQPLFAPLAIDRYIGAIKLFVVLSVLTAISIRHYDIQSLQSLTSLYKPLANILECCQDGASGLLSSTCTLLKLGKRRMEQWKQQFEGYQEPIDLSQWQPTVISNREYLGNGFSKLTLTTKKGPMTLNMGQEVRSTKCDIYL
jgi:hypothetical protein